MKRRNASLGLTFQTASIPHQSRRGGAGGAVRSATVEPSPVGAERPGRLPSRVADFDTTDGLDGDDEVGVVELERRTRHARGTGRVAAEQGVEGVGVYVLCERR